MVQTKIKKKVKKSQNEQQITFNDMADVEEKKRRAP
jgi:hypothetical protein